MSWPEATHKCAIAKRQRLLSRHRQEKGQATITEEFSVTKQTILLQVTARTRLNLPYQINHRLVYIIYGIS